ncbi:hypothetical protein M9Y10_023153 [Tritrichomonas musculus]|uniref:DUF3447 domain-containing protein n=1 Tax=Tritrichomonas musculus TaxID=1915356 RepID=A0ABR2KUL1_9EUKA
MEQIDDQNTINQYVAKMQRLENELISFITQDNHSDEDYENLANFFDEQKIRDQHEFKAILHLIVNISNNYLRNADFFTNIEQILLIFQNEIDDFFSNDELFDIFRDNKRILLFLFEEKLLTPDMYIASIITSRQYKQAFYPHYFSPEFRSFFNISLCLYIDEKNHVFSNNTSFIQNDFETFEVKRLSGENDDFLCQIIQKDSLKEFISYANQKNLALSTKIEPSIFETNSFLMCRNPTLIEYAAFFGSMQIFEYLYSNKVELPPSIWEYAIHGQNKDIIHILERNKILPEDPSYKGCLIESLKCHYFEMTEFIKEKYFKDISDDDLDIYFHSLEFYNFKYLPVNFNDEFNLFYHLCKFDHYPIVELLLGHKKLKINAKHIQKFNAFE